VSVRHRQPDVDRELWRYFLIVAPQFLHELTAPLKSVLDIDVKAVMLLHALFGRGAGPR
jgi:hypothetical protein